MTRVMIPGLALASVITGGLILASTYLWASGLEDERHGAFFPFLVGAAFVLWGILALIVWGLGSSFNAREVRRVARLDRRLRDLQQQLQGRD